MIRNDELIRLNKIQLNLLNLLQYNLYKGQVFYKSRVSFWSLVIILFTRQKFETVQTLTRKWALWHHFLQMVRSENLHWWKRFQFSTQDVELGEGLTVLLMSFKRISKHGREWVDRATKWRKICGSLRIHRTRHNLT